MGHLENASGTAGFIKSVLMLENGMIPPIINLQVLKDSLDIEASRIMASSTFPNFYDADFV
jgi:acyl transferase domain-containing protein